MTTPFPIGVYVGSPNGSNATLEANYEAAYNAFVGVMGAQAQYTDSFVDETKPISQWVSNTGWVAWSQAQSVDARNQIPIISLPMASTAAGSPSTDQFYKNFAAGDYDSTLQGMVKTWANDGFKTQEWRPGWEMNEQSMPSFAGTDAATQADWVAAFQHIYTVLHAAAASDGVTLQVLWNPNITNYTNAEATKTLYPGDQYVDVIAADIYGQLHPYGDTTKLYDWDKSGQVLNSSHPVYTDLQDWAKDPINLEHFYEYPAATQWSLDGSGGHSLSLQNLIDFAAVHNKPFAIPETGVGGTVDGAGVSDNPTFVQWLSDTLTNASVTTEFVNIWDFDNGDNDVFSDAANPKPLEAAAWAKYFGSTTPSSIIVGSGADTVDLKISEDAYLGDAQFTVSVDGTQVGGIQTAQADHASGDDQDFLIKGDWGTGTHDVTVDFLNDAWGGSVSADRNLYVDGASYDGVSAAGGTLFFGRSGSQDLTVGTPSAAPTVLGSGADTIDISMSEQAYLGDAQFTVSVDGVQIGDTQTVTASHAAGDDQHFLVEGDFGVGQHTVSIDFLNDAWGGSTSLDRNLYVDSATFDGFASTSAILTLAKSGTQSFQAGYPDTLSLNVAEDAYLGDAQFTVSVDGTQLGGTYTATASNALGQSQELDFGGSWAQGTHTVAVTFLNDAWGGTALTDRNLYVTGASFDGAAQQDVSLELKKAGTQTFQFQSTSPADASGLASNDSISSDSTADLTTTTASASSSAMGFIADNGGATVSAQTVATPITETSAAQLSNATGLLDVRDWTAVPSAIASSVHATDDVNSLGVLAHPTSVLDASMLLAHLHT